ncbi:MAG: response regulator [Synergistaceae bacterium]|jgi:putative two-component system response regulator|nr:response regulator [Synergistaceae bacterium]
MSANPEEHSILVVDDDATNLRMLQEILKPKYKVYAAPSGGRALAFLERNSPDLILLDVEMPEMNGYQMIKRLKDDPRFQSIPVIFLTAQEGRDKEEAGLHLGAVDYILKPITTGIVMARVNLHIELEDYRKRLETLVGQKTAQLRNTQDSILDILAGVTAWRDSGTGGHIVRTTTYTQLVVDCLFNKKHPNYIITPQYGEHIVKSSKLHDIGKVAISDSILLKPGKLTPEEFDEIKKHTTFGAQMISDAIENLGDDSSFLHVAREIVVSHHEWWDGSGYPNKLAGSDIPISGRIMAVSDIYDSLTSERPYKGVLSHDEAMSIIYDETGRHFDPLMMHLLSDTFPLFERVSEELRGDAAESASAPSRKT